MERNDKNDKLRKYLHEEKFPTLFFDIETYMYNKDEGRKKPTLYKNCVYSVAISFYFEGELCIALFKSFKDLFDLIINTQEDKKDKDKAEIQLIAHNNNKYDNHFLLHDLKYFYDLPVYSLYDTNVKNKARKFLTTQKEVKGENCILEKRIKSKTNLELVIYLEGVKIYTTDNYQKTNLSIATLGKKMLRLGVITEDELKTDYNYTKYDKDEDMEDYESYAYAYDIFENLSEDELKYIRNDVIILAKSWYYYTDLFPGFDYSKLTLTQNIKDSYINHSDNKEETRCQLLLQKYKGKKKYHVKNSSYIFDGENFAHYLRHAYRGGLNFYNDNYIGKIINGPIFAIDINSSYPHIMYNLKIPTYLSYIKEYDKPTHFDINLSDDYFCIYKITLEEFDTLVEQIESKIGRQMLVKYYTLDAPYCYINDNTIRILNDIFHLNIKSIKIKSYVEYYLEYFHGRHEIEKYYMIKEQGKSKKKLKYNTLNDIYETDEINDILLTPEEINNAKVNLNGLYGIPALRAFFNIFLRATDGDIINFKDCFINQERNLAFSVFVTSGAVYNLLSPLSVLTAKEIDENFLYCDTDSLYFKKSTVYDKINIPKFIHERNIGKFSFDATNIEKFYILNHKKYAYVKNNTINIRCGGVPLDSFDTSVSFEDFIKDQFSDGVRIKTQKGILNKQGTISIYPSITELEKGGRYPLYINSPVKDKIISVVKEVILKIEKENENTYTPGVSDDIIYFETPIGCFSYNQLFLPEYDGTQRHLYFMFYQQKDLGFDPSKHTRKEIKI